MMTCCPQACRLQTDWNQKANDWDSWSITTRHSEKCSGADYTPCDLHLFLLPFKTLAWKLLGSLGLLSTSHPVFLAWCPAGNTVMSLTKSSISRLALLHFKQEDLSWVTKGFSVESEGSERSDHRVNAWCLRVGKVQPLRDPRVRDTTQPGASLIHSRTETTREAWPATGSIPFPHPSGDLP